jgi:copper homeostasis protein (lipoprotein)
MTTPRALLLLAFLVLAACQPNSPGAPPAPVAGTPFGAQAFSEGSERTWSGLLPCSDCQGVEVRLVLRLQNGKRQFQMDESYIGGKEPNRFTSRGEWRESAASADALATYTLDPGPAAQEFALQPDGSLQMLDGGGKALEPAVANRLQRL